MNFEATQIMGDWSDGLQNRIHPVVSISPRSSAKANCDYCTKAVAWLVSILA